MIFKFPIRTISVIILLMSPVLVTGNLISQAIIVNEDPDINSPEFQNMPAMVADNNIGLEIINVDNRIKIVLYNNFQNRDAALSSLSESNIQYIFQSIPAITLKDVQLSQISSSGLLQVVNDRKVGHIQSTKELVELDTNDVGMTLAESSFLIGISQIREEYGLTGSGTKIALLDSGVNPALPAFLDSNGNTRVQVHNVSGIVQNAAIQLDDHGSHVAGIAAGNGQFVIRNELLETTSKGMAPNSDILSIRVLDETGSGDNSWILEGIDYALQSDADVISMSLSTNLYYGELDLHKILLDQAPSLGKIVVAAAGNQGPMGSGLGIPGGLESVIGVGASKYVKVEGKDEKLPILWDASGVGPGTGDISGPDLIAPGEDIISVNVTSNTINSLTGTSMAAPHISGGILLLREAFPTSSVYQIREALLSSAQDISSPVESQGRGVVDFVVAYSNLKAIIEEDKIFAPTLPNRFDDGNFYYRNRIDGLTKSFPIYLFSHKNSTIFPKIDELKTNGVSFNFPDSINIIEGFTKFNLDITVDEYNVQINSGLIYFVDGEGTLIPSANITYESETRFARGNVLFDTSHDQDTPSGYFANHGPRGQFSKISRTLEEEGYVIREHSKGELNDSILKNIDLLLIANPDENKTFSSAELSAIRSFVYTEGKSLFIIVNGGLMTAEDLKYEDFNLDQLNSILFGSGIIIDSKNAVIKCDEIGIGRRYTECPKDAFTISTQTVLASNINFPSYGPALSTSDDVNGSAFDIAYQSDEAVAVGAELNSGGRILVFSSSLPFDNIGTTTDYVGSGSDVNNRQIARDSFAWLMEMRSMKVEYFINTGVLTRFTSLNLNEQYKLLITITFPNGKGFDFGSDRKLRSSFNPVNGSSKIPLNFTLVEIGLGQYEIDIVFPIYGFYDLYLPISVDGFVSTSARISIFVSNYLSENAQNVQNVAQLLLILLLISWIMWIRNEGGWEKKKK